MQRIAFIVCALAFAAAAQGESPATRAWFRDDGTLMVDGRSVMPIGMFSATLRGENCRLFADLGFNCVTNGGDTEDVFFDAANDAGLLVLAPHYNWATFAGSDERLDLNKHEKAGFDAAFTYRDQIGRTIAQNLKQWDHRPGVIGWYTAEEPKASYTEALEFMYELIKSHSPAHIVVTLSAEPVWYHHFRKTADVLMIDLYPYRDGANSQPLIWTYEMTRRARQAVAPKPVWFLGQAGNMWKNRDTFTPLSLDQFRNQAYLALIGGAKGYFLFSYATATHFDRLNAKQQQEQWKKIGQVVSELRTLAPMICDGKVSDGVRLAWSLPEGQGMPPLSRVIEYDGAHYLMVANLNEQAIEGKVLGTNYGFAEAFTADVLTNPAGLSATGLRDQETAETVNAAKRAALPVIRIAGRASGAFRLTRRPAPQPSR